MKNPSPALRNLAAIGSLLILTLGASVADDKSWTSAAAANWNSANWSPAGTPGPGDNIVSPTAVGRLDLNVDAEVNDWTFTSGSQWIVRAAGGARLLEINGNLTKSSSAELTFSSFTSAPLTFSIGGNISVGLGNMNLGAAGNSVLASLSVAGTTTVNTAGTGGLTLIATTATFGPVDLQTALSRIILYGTTGSTAVSMAGLSGNGSITGGSNLGSTATATLTLDGSGSHDFSGALRNYGNNAGGTSISTVSLVKAGSGTQGLSGLNAYTAGTTINNGVLSVNSLVNGDLVTMSGTTTASSNIMTVASTAGLSVGQAVLGVTTGNGNVVTIAAILDGTTVQLSGSTSAGGAGTSNRMFGTQSSLGMASTDASGLIINGGTLRFTGGNSTVASTNRLFTLGTSGGGLDASGTVAMSLTNTGAIALSGSGARTLTLSGTSTEGNSLAAALGDNGGATSVVKNGAGTWAMAGSSSYTGGTVVSAGTLLVSSGSGSALGTGNVAVNGGRLGGTGTIELGSNTISVAGGAGLLGGDGTTTGTLTINSNVTLADNSLIVLTLASGGTHSTIARTGGSWVFDSDQAFSFIDGGGALGAYSNIITGLASDPGVGSWTIANVGWAGTFSYDSGNVSFNLTSVPEPSVWLLAGAGAFLVFARRRFDKAS